MLNKIGQHLQGRKFEKEGGRSIALNSGVVVNNVEYATHETVFDGKAYDEFLEGIEEEKFIDDSFPPEKSSILGLGCREGMEGEPVDQVA